MHHEWDEKPGQFDLEIWADNYYGPTWNVEDQQEAGGWCLADMDHHQHVKPRL